MKTSLLIAISFLLFGFQGCKNKIHKSGSIKSIKGYEFYLENNGDSVFTLTSQTKYNRKGDLTSQKEFSPSGKILKEIVFTYTLQGQPKIKKEIDYSFDSSVTTSEFYFDDNDSLIALIISDESRTSYRIFYKRDASGKLIEEREFQGEETMPYSSRIIVYDQQGRVRAIDKFRSDTLIESIEKFYGSGGLLVKEKIHKKEQLDMIYFNFYQYDSLNRNTLKKSYWLNDSNYHESRMTYYENGGLKETTQKCIGCLKSIVRKQVLNEQGYLIRREQNTSSGEQLKVWTYDFTYDKFNNWITQYPMYPGRKEIGTKRVIEYYE